MEIKEFLELWAGQWFAQRTSYQLHQAAIDNSKSEMTVAYLETAHPGVIKLCQRYEVESNLSLGAIQVHWDTSVDWGKSKQTGSNLLIFLETGEFLQTNHRGEYALGNDEALTLSIDSPELHCTERIWFASPNLKLRTVLTRYPDLRTQTAFYTEIRKMAKPD